MSFADIHLNLTPVLLAGIVGDELLAKLNPPKVAGCIPMRIVLGSSVPHGEDPSGEEADDSAL